jgi:hypothetical protein
MKRFSLFIALVIFVFAANLFAQLPQHYNFNTNGTNNSFPFNVMPGKMVQSLYLPGAFTSPTAAPSGWITEFWFRVGDAYPLAHTYVDLYIRMGRTNLTTLPPGAFYTGTLDTVWKRANHTITQAGGTWYKFTLDTPFRYYNDSALIVEIGRCSVTPSTGFSVCNTTVAYNGRSWSSAGCPFTYGGQGLQIMNSGIAVVPAAPQHYNYNVGGGDNSFPMNQPAGKMVQWLVGASEYAQPTPALPGGSITALYLRISGTYPLGPATYTNFHVLFGQSAITTLPTGAFYTGTMDTVYRRTSVTFQAAINTWLLIPLDAPFPYNPAQSLIIQIGQCGATGTTTGFSLTHTILTGFRRSWSVGGCPFVWAGQQANVLHNGLAITYPVGAGNNNNEVPNSYKLEQNYPNPFNPVTSIAYSIPKSGPVKLTIYDMLGREVAVLVNEFKQAGSFSVDFDASELSSGAYLYKIEAGDFRDSKKMMLVK